LYDTRTNHWLGMGTNIHPNFDGSIAFLRIWHGEALTQNEVTALNTARDVRQCPVDSYSPTGDTRDGNTCEQYEASKASGSAASACKVCASGITNSDRSECLLGVCGLGSGASLLPASLLPDTTGIRLQTASGTPSFDSEGQV